MIFFSCCLDLYAFAFKYAELVKGGLVLGLISNDIISRTSKEGYRRSIRHLGFLMPLLFIYLFILDANIHFIALVTVVYDLNSEYEM